MPILTDEPALSFWLRYAEREGALVEDRDDHALVLLPDALRQDSGLPEEAIVTAKPDVAREEGATLLIAGHPEVERAAAAVLAEGDTGYGYLPWPASRPPTRSTLEARARESVSVEHGRIDAAGEPIAAYLPLLRVGAMVSFAASLALRFHEQEEVWVDARTGTEVGERLMSTVRGRALLPVPDGARRRLEADLTAAIPAAHRQLEERALRRESSSPRTHGARSTPSWPGPTRTTRPRSNRLPAGVPTQRRIAFVCSMPRPRRRVPNATGAAARSRTSIAPATSCGRSACVSSICRRSSCRPKSAAEPGGLGSNSPGFRPPASSPTSAARPATRPSRSSRRASGSAVKRARRRAVPRRRRAQPRDPTARGVRRRRGVQRRASPGPMTSPSAVGATPMSCRSAGHRTSRALAPTDPNSLGRRAPPPGCPVGGRVPGR